MPRNSKKHPALLAAAAVQRYRANVKNHRHPDRLSVDHAVVDLICDPNNSALNQDERISALESYRAAASTQRDVVWEQMKALDLGKAEDAEQYDVLEKAYDYLDEAMDKLEAMNVVERPATAV